MCDGQYRLMQNYLREQKDNLSNVNVVGEVALFIQNFSLTVDSETMDLLHLILQTLIEMCVGNYPNQLVIYNRQIIESLNHIFTLDVYDEETNSPRGDVKNVSVAMFSDNGRIETCSTASLSPIHHEMLSIKTQSSTILIIRGFLTSEIQL